MGMDLNGILFYGFPLEEDAFDGEDWEDLYTTKRGLRQPASKDYQSIEWHTYWAQKRELLKALKVTIQRCGYNAEVKFVQFDDLSVRSEDWSVTPVDLDFTDLEVEDARNSIRDFCEVMGIEFQEPWFHITAIYW